MAISASVLCLFNIKTSTRQGINHKVRVYNIPLYIKAIEFIDRDYRYRALAREITQEKPDDEEKVLAIFQWVRANIKTDIPDGWPIYDDHILNIIIRGYAASDQINDVFTTLCAYSGLPAGWTRVFVPGNRQGLVLSLVNVRGRWLVFDLFRGVYFINREGKIASTDDILSGRYKKDGSSSRTGSSSLTYEDYFKHMERYLGNITLRAEKQMPFHRMFYEARGLLGRKTKEAAEGPGLP
jgi:hypothetical protein